MPTNSNLQTYQKTSESHQIVASLVLMVGFWSCDGGVFGGAKQQGNFYSI